MLLTIMQKNCMTSTARLCAYQSKKDCATRIITLVTVAEHTQSYSPFIPFLLCVCTKLRLDDSTLQCSLKQNFPITHMICLRWWKWRNLSKFGSFIKSTDLLNLMTGLQSKMIWPMKQINLICVTFFTFTLVHQYFRFKFWAGII